MARSILSGVGIIIDEVFGLSQSGPGSAPHYRHRETCKILSKKQPENFDAEKLIERVYERINSNRQSAADRSSSTQNWRFNPIKGIAPKNFSPEVKLERAIVNLPGHSTWVNAVPTSSGIMNPSSDKKRNIDLVHKHSDDSYEFVELKVLTETNNPLYAAMEILQYGILYIYSRETKIIKDATTEKQLLNAKNIYLRVLATSKYYEGFKLDWLESKLSAGLQRFLKKKKIDLHMDFKFESFPVTFIISKVSFPSDDIIQRALECRGKVLWA